MKAIDRLFEYLEFKGIKPTRLEKEIGLSNGYLGVQRKRNADIGSGVLEQIVNYCRDLNIEWLITGAGYMIYNKPPSIPGLTPVERGPQVIHPSSLGNKELLDRIERLSAEKALLEKELEEIKRGRRSGYMAAEP